MKIFSTAQIREWEHYTIQHQAIRSIELMERAAIECYNWLLNNQYQTFTLYFFCGNGNNGGDGLALARLCIKNGIKVKIFLLDMSEKGSLDFEVNLKKIHDLSIEISIIKEQRHFPTISTNAVIIDALLGTGINKPLNALTTLLVQHLNAAKAPIISIDTPSGLFIDKSSINHVTIEATHTLSFQVPKLAFFLPENENKIGHWHILDIGLNQKYYETQKTKFELIDTSTIINFYTPRKKFAHKGSFGHALLVVGSYGKMGAAVLTAKACLRSGVGLLTCHIPKCGYAIMQTATPETMITTDECEKEISNMDAIDFDRYNSIGIGPGMDSSENTHKCIAEYIVQNKTSLILDADALNILSKQKELIKQLPSQSIITPHLKEFERLFGISQNDFDRIDLALEQATKLNIFIVLKGHHTFIACPDGKGYFNTTGNPGMSTAGSGDVLTGILTALKAQHYTSEKVCLLGVYLHGLAGDIAAQEKSEESMIANDIIDNLGAAFKKVAKAQLQPYR